MFTVSQQELDHYSQKWKLFNLKLLSLSSTSYLLEGYQESSRSKVILKFGHSKSEIISEASALKFYNGLGCVRLLALDEENGVLLRSYAYPTSLKSFFPDRDDDAILCAINVMKKLHSKNPQKDRYPTITHWLSSLKDHNIISKWHIDRAKLIAKELLCSSEQNVLLHGDLHHFNILQTEQGEWVAIDPKGVIGDAAYEIGAFVRNPMPELLEYNKSITIERRIKIFSEYLGIDEKRIWRWSYVQSILSASFAIEDDQPWEPWIKCAELIYNSCRSL